MSTRQPITPRIPLATSLPSHATLTPHLTYAPPIPPLDTAPDCVGPLPSEANSGGMDTSHGGDAGMDTLSVACDPPRYRTAYVGWWRAGGLMIEPPPPVD